MKWLRVLLLVSFALLISCSAPSGGRKKILVSPKGLTHNFWLSVKAGAKFAGKEFNVDILWKGPAVETDIAGQISIVEDYINKKVDAIVLAACDTKALVGTVEKAQSAGIPVITIDSGLESDIPLSFVATDNIAAAKKAADVLSELLGGKGKVACIPFVAGAATSIMREQGFKEGLKSHPGLELVAVQYSQSDVAIGMAVTENILTANPDLGGIFAASEPGAIGSAQALIGRGVAGKVKLVSFDAAPNEVKALEQGTMQALIVQNPFKMGYEGVKAAVAALNGEPVNERIDTGVYIVTKENLYSPEIQKIINPVK